MTTLLRSRLGTGRADLQEWSWRRVPKVSLLPPEGSALITPRVQALGVLLAILALGAVVLYRDLGSTQEALSKAQSELDAVGNRIGDQESAISDESEKIGALDEEFNKVDEQRASVDVVRVELSAAQPDWGAALEALMAADGGGLRFNRVAAGPEGTLSVTLSLEGVGAVGTFLNHMKDVEDIIELPPFHIEQGDAVQILFAEVKVLKEIEASAGNDGGGGG